jgi:hypothetical protein
VIDAGELLTRNCPSSVVVNPEFGTSVYVQSFLNVKIPDSEPSCTVPDHLQLPNNVTPGNCVPHANCCGEEEDNDDG